MAQKNAKRILSWVACSAQPIARQEMELAMLIEPDTEIVPRVRAELNALQLCGPLVEVRNGNLQFVHFTAKEYVNCPYFYYDVLRKTYSNQLVT